MNCLRIDLLNTYWFLHISIGCDAGATLRLPVVARLRRGCDAGATPVRRRCDAGATLVNEKIYVVTYVVRIYEVKS